MSKSKSNRAGAAFLERMARDPGLARGLEGLGGEVERVKQAREDALSAIAYWIDKLRIPGEDNRGWLSATRNYLAAHGFKTSQFDQMTVGEVIDLLRSISEVLENETGSTSTPNQEADSLTIADHALAAIKEAYPNWITARAIGEKLGKSPKTVRAALSQEFKGRTPPYESNKSCRRLGYRWYQTCG